MKGMGEGMGAWTSKMIGPEPRAARDPLPPEAPPAVTIAELDFLTDDQKAVLAALGREFRANRNPPAWVGDEGTWTRAKEAVEKYWDRYDEPYAVTSYVYRSMGGTVA